MLKYRDNRLKGRGVTGGQFFGFFRKSVITQKRGGPIKMISRGFAANDIANVVLKFGDNRTKGNGVTEVVNLRKI